MFYRRLPVLMFIGLVLLIIGCSTASVTAIQVTPSTATATVGQTMQFTATATYTQGTHQGSNQNDNQLGSLVLQQSERRNNQLFRYGNSCRGRYHRYYGKHERVSWPCVQHG